ncbi:MAG: hypothetical protein ABL962_01485, partial [Fimbriimonadaceae bacterium]
PLHREPTLEIFPFGVANRRYTFFYSQPSTLACMELRKGRIIEKWYAELTDRQDQAVIDTVGSLGAWLARRNLLPLKGKWDSLTRVTLNAKKSYVVYAIDDFGYAIRPFVIDEAGREKTYERVEFWRVGDPYPIPPEEQDYLGWHRFKRDPPHL